MPDSCDDLERLLDHLAASGIGAKSAAKDELHRAALDYGEVERLPVVFSYPYPEAHPFQPLPNGRIYGDPAAMLYNELLSAWETGPVPNAGIGDDLPLTVRPNWGTGVVASVLGGTIEQSGDETPWVRRLEDQAQLLEELGEIEPDLRRDGLVSRVLETYEAYRRYLDPYPELRSAVSITLPDLQGPLDTVEQLAGESLLVSMLSDPDAAARALQRTADIQIACAELFSPLVREGRPGYSHQHGFLLRGNVLIRCDSAVMISPGLYAQLIGPADEKVLAALGGGGIHSCGRIGHAMPRMLELPSLRCFDFGQSEMNDIDGLYRAAAERRIPLLRIHPTREELETGSILRRFPTGVSLSFRAASLDDAERLFDRYLTAAACPFKGGRQ